MEGGGTPLQNCKTQHRGRLPITSQLPHLKTRDKQHVPSYSRTQKTWDEIDLFRWSATSDNSDLSYHWLTLYKLRNIPSWLRASVSPAVTRSPSPPEA